MGNNSECVLSVWPSLKYCTTALEYCSCCLYIKFKDRIGVKSQSVARDHYHDVMKMLVLWNRGCTVESSLSSCTILVALENLN